MGDEYVAYKTPDTIVAETVYHFSEFGICFVKLFSWIRFAHKYFLLCGTKQTNNKNNSILNWGCEDRAYQNTFTLVKRRKNNNKRQRCVIIIMLQLLERSWVVDVVVVCRILDRQIILLGSKKSLKSKESKPNARLPSLEAYGSQTT